MSGGVSGGLIAALAALGTVRPVALLSLGPAALKLTGVKVLGRLGALAVGALGTLALKLTGVKALGGLGRGLALSGPPAAGEAHAPAAKARAALLLENAVHIEPVVSVLGQLGEGQGEGLMTALGGGRPDHVALAVLQLQGASR